MSKILLSCTTMLDYVAKAQEACGTDYPVIELDRKYHEDPSAMCAHIREVLAGLPADVDTVLFAMGFCGGSWKGLTCDRTMILPKTADCIAMVLTTPEKYALDLKQAGHMYSFGDNANGFSIRTIHDNLARDYDEETADIVFDMYFENYHHLDVIEDGIHDVHAPEILEKAEKDAESIHSELVFVKGSNVMLEELVSGKWDEHFLVIAPGEPIPENIFYGC